MSPGTPHSVAPERAAGHPAADELQARLQRMPDRGLAPEQLAALVEIHRAVAGHRDLKALFTAIAQALQGVHPVSRVMLALESDDPSAFTVYDNVGDSAEVRQGQTLPRAGSVGEWMFEHRRPLVVGRAEGIRERFPASYERLRQWGIESVASVPLLTEGRCVGVLSLVAEQADAWAGVPPVLLDEIAASIAVAVDHCIAYESLARARDEEAALLEINRAVARHLHRDKLFAALVQCLRDLVPSDRSGIALPADGGKLTVYMLATSSAHHAPVQEENMPALGDYRWVAETGQWFIASSREELRARFPDCSTAVMEREGMQSACAVPLLSGQRCLGVLFFMAAREAAFQGLRRDLIDQVASAVAVALDHCLAYEEVRNLRDRLVRENVYLQEEIRHEHPFEDLVGSSPTLRAVLRKVDQVAPTTTSVLILGETGTGKELIARAIHNRSARRDRPLVKVNCTAISAGLVESELFGHVKGAFTGAVERRVGRFELADGGTIFLDEIAELPLETQVKLLRVLQEQEFEPVGSSRTLRVDVRVIAATNRDLQDAMRTGRFRSDLFYRLNVFPIEVPPLRERRADIPPLVMFFVSRFSRKLGKQISAVAPETMERLTAYQWPGNVRELQNVIERAVILCEGPVLEIDRDLVPLTLATNRASEPLMPSGTAQSSPGDELPGAARRAGPADIGSLDEMERRHIIAALESTAGVIHGPRGAAQILKLHPNTLRSRMAKLGITFKRHRQET